MGNHNQAARDMKQDTPIWFRSLSWCACAVLAILLVMGSSETCLASAHGDNSHGETETEAESDDAAGAKTRGLELGEFRIRAYYPVQAQKSMVRFVLFATVSGERYSTSKQLMQNRRHKIRDQVITATRMVPLVEFDQPDLASFRRRILLRLRRTLPELEIDDVYVSNFELKVQNL
jgi:hypothetical protein